MNREFTDEQVKVYARNFREGDAVWSDGEWHEVEYDSINRATPNIATNKYVLNRLVGSDESETERLGALRSFRSYKPYRVTTLEHYKIKGGERIIWLGKSNPHRTFGKAYIVNEHLVYEDDEEYTSLIENPLWGVIPKWSNVKPTSVEKPISNPNYTSPTIQEQLHNIASELLSNKKYEPASEVLELLYKFEGELE